MEKQPTPFGQLDDATTGPGTATARASAPVIDLELADSVPVAYRPDEIAREAPRYLVFVGDVISPRQKRERPDLRLGGEYLGQQVKTLVRSKYLVRRCQITPMEIGYDYINDELLGDNPNGLTVMSQLNASGDKAPIQLGGRLNAVPCYPGDEIKTVLIGDYNADAAKGIVEVKALAGVDYPDFAKSGIQKFIFPDWDQIIAGVEGKALPVQISALVSHFQSRRSATKDEGIRDVIDAFLSSADQYREWGMRYLKYSSMLVRQPAHQGFVHTYSDIAEMLFDQLEITREDLLRSDTGNADLNAAIARANAGESISSAEVKSLINLVAQNQELLMGYMTGKIPTSPDKSPVVPVGTAAASEPEVTTAPGQAVVTEPSTVELDPRLCSVITGSGRQCQKLAREDGRCELPAHQKKEGE